MNETTPPFMQAVMLTGHGGPDKLRHSTDVPRPQPGPHDALIKVSASAVNNTDINTRIGWYSKNGDTAEDAGWAGNALTFPRIQGADACGFVAAIGDQVTGLSVGQRVLVEPCLRYANGHKLDAPWYLGSECDGAFADYVCVDARHAYPVDSSLSDAELASFPCSYSTAENMLTRATVGPSDHVVITGASGGVGSATIQLAKARGARVTALSTMAKKDQLQQIGADQVIDRTADLLAALGKDSVDVVIDLVAGPQWPVLLDILRPFGRYAVAGAIAGPHVALDVRTLYLKDLSFFGCTVLEPQVFGNLIKRIEANQIRPLVAQTFPLRDIAAAQTLFEAKHHIGKLVLTLG